MIVKSTLAGTRVLDVSHYIAGPYCTKQLVGLGAEVIKVEKPGEGDGARRIGPFPNDELHPEKSGLFLYLNTNKKGITLNLKTETGKSIFKELVKTSDVVVESFEPRVMPSLGLSYEELKKSNPSLVMTSISNFGQTGPYRDYRAEEIIAFAMGGLMYLVGHPDGEPLKFGGSTAQYMAGLAGFTATMMAFYHAEETGNGQQVDVSIMESIASSHFQSLVNYAYTGTIQQRNRTMLIFPCKDGYVSPTVQQYQWHRVPALMGMPELLDDPRFQTQQARLEHADELEVSMMPWMIERTKEEIYRAGQEAGIPFAYFASCEDLLNSPQYAARGFFVDIEHPIAGKITYPGTPLTMGDLPWQHQRAPLLGEHNQEIYCHRLGYSRQDMVKLRATGII